MIAIDCVSSFCGLVHDAGPTYGHAVTLNIVISYGQCINVIVTGVVLANYCTKEFGSDKGKINLL